VPGQVCRRFGKLGVLFRHVTHAAVVDVVDARREPGAQKSRGDASAHAADTEDSDVAVLH